ncbi:MAG: ATP-binding cassette domain-containing protein [Bacteroidales bacterium]|nr:ATP-binding cassette domain-containing protein [Bacteroidales bacterium]
MSESEVAGSDIYLQPSVLFERGRKYMVCARSGHGKTSLLNFIYGSNLNYDGEILYHSHLSPFTSHLSPFYLRLRHLSYLFQDLCLFPELTAMENVLIKNNLTHHKSNAEILTMLDSVLPSDKKHQPLRTLSLGQRQRVAAVRALCQPFQFLLMDEPFSHLDRETSQAVAAMVLREVEAQNAGIILTALDALDFFPFDTTLNL